MDTYAGSLRMITNGDTSNPMSKKKLSTDTWTHVAATVDGHTGETMIYINGKEVERQ